MSNTQTQSDIKTERTSNLQALKKYGIKVGIQYVFDCLLFDVIHKTDTSTRIYTSDFKTKLQNIENGNAYGASWTSEIKRSFTRMHEIVEDMSSYTFVDIGCGKGKVVLVWQRLLNNLKIQQNVLGIDYYEPLIRAAERNHKKMFGNSGRFMYADATAINYDDFGNKLIIYLFNPFDEELLAKVLQKINNEDIYIVYNNPVHSRTLSDFGYDSIYWHDGGCPALQTNVFKRRIESTPPQP